jgi:hypothetical protein
MSGKSIFFNISRVNYSVCGEVYLLHHIISGGYIYDPETLAKADFTVYASSVLFRISDKRRTPSHEAV